MDVPTFERLSEAVIGGSASDPSAFQAANMQIMELGSTTENIPLLQEVFTSSNSSAAILVAANCLTSLMTEYWTSFTESQRVEMRDYLLTFVANKGAELQLPAIRTVAQLICRITKYGWLDDTGDMRQIVDHTTKFLQHTVSHCVIGLTILNTLVTEMNYKSTNRTITQHRKVATSFRDLALFQVFEISLSMINQVATRSVSVDGLTENEARRMEDNIADLSLSLLISCLSFDFIGTNPEDDSEINAIQVPASWRDRLQTGAPLRLLFNLYKGFTTGKIATIPDAQAPPIKPTATLAQGSGSSPAIPRTGAFGGAYGGPPFSGLAGGAATTRDMPVSMERAAQVLEALSMMVSIRRSLFSIENERKRFLSSIIRGTCDVLRDEAGFTDEKCFHEFTRLLSKIKVSFQLAELVAVEGYSEWISMTAKFTIRCCQTPSWSGNSMSYLLSLWSRLVASVPYLLNEYSSRGGPATSPTPDFAFDQYVPKIVAEYVKGRLDALSNPDTAETILEQLDDLATVEDELEHLPSIARYAYQQTAQVLVDVVEPLLSRYHEGLQFVRSNTGSGASLDSALAALKQLECQLAWIVTVIGAIVGGGGANSMSAPLYTNYAASILGGGLSVHASSVAQSGEEIWDAELIKRVLSLIAQLDENLTEAANGQLPATAVTNPYVRLSRVDPRLELAFIYFLNNFRKAYINEQGGLPTQTMGTASVAAANAATSQSFLLSDTKPMTTAQAFEAAKAALAEPLSLQDMYESATGRTKTFLSMLIRLGVGDHTVVVTLMITKLANNLRYWAERDDIIARSLDVLNELIFSYSSGRLLLTLDVISTLLVNHGEDYFPFLSAPQNVRYRTQFYSALARLVFMEDENEKFDPFIEPICMNLEKLAPVVQTRATEVRQMIIGVCRDLRGILQAAHNRPTYAQVFDAIFPRHVQTLVQAMEVWWDDPPVTTSLLKFMAELVFNRGQRIQFGTASANGILLFREASNMIVGYGQKIADVTPSGDIYVNKYKGITIVLAILLKALDGGYVNFGVFPLYGDAALENALAMTLKLTLPLGLDSINAHPKFALAFISFLHDAFRSHMDYLVTLDTSSFLSLIHALTTALDSLSPEVSSQGAYGLDHLASYYVRNFRKDNATMGALRSHLSNQPTIFEVLLKIVFEIVVFGEIGNQWSMARPLLPLILAAELTRPGSFVEFKNDVITNQPSDAQAKMEEEFDKLMKDITRTLDVVNRDKFQNRITVFKITVKEFAKIP